MTAPTGTHLIQSVRAQCLAAVDGSGVLMLQGGDVLDLPDAHTRFVSPDGTLRSQADGTFSGNLLGQLTGFEGTLFEPPAFDISINRWDANGNITAKVPPRSTVNFAANDPLGGIAVLLNGSPVESYDENLHLRWSANTFLGGPAGMIVDRLGNTLFLYEDLHDPKTLDGVWIDHAGVESAPFQLLTNLEMPAHLGTGVLTRVGGGAFIFTDEQHEWQLDSMSTKLEPAPAFVKRFDDGSSSVFLVHGGRGYALVSNFGGGIGTSCDQAVEILSPSGKSCGKTSFPAGPGQCEFVSATVGYDGTYVQRMAPPVDQCMGGVCNCQFQWWTGFLH